jgi:hypothetical protein
MFQMQVELPLGDMPAHDNDRHCCSALAGFVEQISLCINASRPQWFTFTVQVPEVRVVAGNYIIAPTPYWLPHPWSS